MTAPTGTLIHRCAVPLPPGEGFVGDGVLDVPFRPTAPRPCHFEPVLTLAWESVSLVQGGVRAPRPASGHGDSIAEGRITVPVCTPRACALRHCGLWPLILVQGAFRSLYPVTKKEALSSLKALPLVRVSRFELEAS